MRRSGSGSGRSAPIHFGVVQINGLHVEPHGSGAPPIVFTHGFARDAGAWDRQVKDLAADHFVVTWDLRGHRHSPAPDGDYTREAALADLRSVVDLARADGRGPAVLVGHSLGGYLSLAYALGAPETVAGMVLLSTGPGFRNPDSMVSYNRGIGKMAAAAGIPANAAEVGVHRDSMVIDRLAEITCPVVMISGVDDLPIYRTGVTYLSQRLPSATLVEIEGAAHEPHLDRPEAVIAAIRSHPALAAGSRR